MMRVFNVFGRLGWRTMVALGVVLAALTAPAWGESLLARLSYFRVRHVEIYGRRYLSPDDVLARMRVDTMASVWGDLAMYERRIARHPLVRSVTVERKLPGTLVVRVEENRPVAFVPAAGGLRAVDASGRLLPIDPSTADVDLPIVARADTALLRLLADVHTRAPGLYQQISSARRVGRDELAVEMSSVLVRAPADIAADRLADIVPVENDLARRHARAAELDLRYRDQVIARLQ